MPRISMPQADQVHIKSKASSDRSLEVVTLKQRATPYRAGTVVVAEYVADVATGLYVDPATSGVDVSAYDIVTAAVIHNRIDASEANRDALAIVREAEVYGNLISLKDLAGAEKTAVAEALASAQVIVR